MKKEWGASVVEYTILVSLVVLVVVGAMTALGRQINHTLPEGGVSGPTTTARFVTSTTCSPTPTSTSTPPPPNTSTTTTAPGGC